MVDFFVMVRRLALLYVVMFVPEHSWFKIEMFTAFSLAQLCYLADSRPYKEQKENYLNMFNEGATLIVSYFVLVMNGICVEVK